MQALSASPGRGRHPLPPWQWVLSGRLPACDLTFPTCKRKVKSPARNASAGPQAQSQRSGMAVSFLSRTSNTSSISGILSLANNRTSYLTGTQVGPFTRLEVREPELGREEVSTLLPSSTGFGLRGSDVLCQLLNSAVTTRAQTDRVWVKARAAFRHDRPRGRAAGGGPLVGGSAAAKTASLPAPPRCVCRCRVLGVSTAQLPPRPRARRRSQADGAKAASAGPACAGRKTSPRSRSGRPGSSRRRGREASHWQPPWADETRDKGAWRWGLRPAPSASPSAPGIGPSLGSGARAEPARTAPWTHPVGIREQMAPRVGRRPHD